MSDTDIPRFEARGGKRGHSTLDALDAARRLGAWLAERPDVRVWGTYLDLTVMVKMIVRDMDSNIVFYAEVATGDVETISDAIGVSRDATATVNTLMRDGFGALDAGCAAALVG